MKPFKVLLVVLPVLLLTVLFVVVRRQRTSAAYLLRQYEVGTMRKPSFFSQAKLWHLEDTGPFKPKPLLLISTFTRSQKGGAVRGGTLCTSANSLPRPTIERLRAKFSLLPENTQSLPPLEELMVVSFRQNGKWHTRLYNRKSPPAVMEEIDYLMHPKSPKSKARHKREQHAPKVLPMAQPARRESVKHGLLAIEM